jgi:hypothetical protein
MPSQATNDPADTKRCESCGVWTLFDDAAKIILSLSGAVTHHLSGIRANILCLTVEILDGPCCLLRESFGLSFRIACDAAKPFFHLAAKALGGAGYRSSFIDVSLLG